MPGPPSAVATKAPPTFAPTQTYRKAPPAAGAASLPHTTQSPPPLPLPPTTGRPPQSVRYQKSVGGGGGGGGGGSQPHSASSGGVSLSPPSNYAKSPASHGAPPTPSHGAPPPPSVKSPPGGRPQHTSFGAQPPPQPPPLVLETSYQKSQNGPPPSSALASPHTSMSPRVKMPTTPRVSPPRAPSSRSPHASHSQQHTTSSLQSRPRHSPRRGQSQRRSSHHHSHHSHQPSTTDSYHHHHHRRSAPASPDRAPRHLPDDHHSLPPHRVSPRRPRAATVVVSSPRHQEQQHHSHGHGHGHSHSDSHGAQRSPPRTPRSQHQHQHHPQQHPYAASHSQPLGRVKTRSPPPPQHHPHYHQQQSHPPPLRDGTDHRDRDDSMRRSASLYRSTEVPASDDDAAAHLARISPHRSSGGGGGGGGGGSRRYVISPRGGGGGSVGVGRAHPLPPAQSPRNRFPEDRYGYGAGDAEAYDEDDLIHPFARRDSVVRGQFVVEGCNYARFESAGQRCEASRRAFTTALRDDIVACVGRGVRRHDIMLRAAPGPVRGIVLEYDDDRLASSPQMVDADWGIEFEYAIRVRSEAVQKQVGGLLYEALTSEEGLDLQEARHAWVHYVDEGADPGAIYTLTTQDATRRTTGGGGRSVAMTNVGSGGHLRLQ